MRPCVSLLPCYLQDKRNASMALQCLAWCVGTFLRRMAPPRITRAKLADWAGWAVAPAIQGAFKGGLGAPEQQASFCEGLVCQGVCSIVAKLLFVCILLLLLS